jgi:hypothetical protein
MSENQRSKPERDILYGLQKEGKFPEIFILAGV